jgi:hypothetical protein
MAKISSYPNADSVTLSDRLIGTEVGDDNATKNFSVGSMLALANDPALLTNFVPYTGATDSVDLDGYNIRAEEGNFSSLYEYNEKCFSFGQYYSSTTQQHTSIGVALNVQFGSPILSNGVTVATLEKLNFAWDGVYMIELKARVEHTGGGGDAQLSFWLTKLGANVPFSRQVYTIANTHIEEITYSMLVNVLSTDDITIAWSTTNTAAKLISTTAGGIYPMAPSAIVNVYKIGFLP